jgi:hypothetical protein
MSRLHVTAERRQVDSANTSRSENKTLQFPDGPLILFLAYVGYIYLEIGIRIEFLGAIRGQVVLAFLLLALAEKNFPRVRNDANRPLFVWMSLLVALILLMSFVTKAPELSSQILMEREVAYWLYALFIVAFIKNVNALRWFIIVFMLVFLRMAYEGFVGWYTGDLVWQNQEIMRLHGATPIYRHPNSFGATQLGTIPFLYFYFVHAGWKVRGIFVVQAILALNVVLHAGSRTTYVGFVGVLLYFWIHAKSRLRAGLVIVLMAAAVLPFIPEEYLGRFNSILAPAEQATNGSKLARLQINRDSRQVLLEHPLGIGVGAYPVVRMQKFGREQDTHNLYYEVATNLGVQGLIVFMGLIVTVFGSLRSARARVRRMQQSLRANQLPASAVVNENKSALRDLIFLESTINALIAFLILRLWVGLFGHDLYEVYWWFLIGLAMALQRIVATIDVELFGPALRADRTIGAKPII